MSREQRRMSETGIHWIFDQQQSEILVTLSPATVRHALQQGIRGFLCEEQNNEIIAAFLHADEDDRTLKYASRVKAMGTG